MVEDREEWLAATFVELADTLVADFDLLDLLYVLVERCAELLDPAEVGIVLASAPGRLQVMVSSTERMRVVELFEVQNEAGPCLECYQSGEQVLNQRLSAGETRWPRFTQMARNAGFEMVHALPMRLRSSRIGAMNIFSPEAIVLGAREVHLAQALADAATIGILQERSVRQLTDLSRQLEAALNTRIVIEQAKGVVAERQKVPMDEAFGLLRAYARTHNLLLADVAAMVINGRLPEVEVRERVGRAIHPAKRST
jgi:GAF domain-containing protein